MALSLAIELTDEQLKAIAKAVAEEIGAAAQPKRGLLTVREAAARLNICESRVRELFNAGLLEGRRTGERGIRIFSDDVEAVVSGEKHLNTGRARMKTKTKTRNGKV